MVANVLDVEVFVVTQVSLQKTYHTFCVSDWDFTFWRHIRAPKPTVRSFHQLQLVHFHYVRCVNSFTNEVHK